AAEQLRCSRGGVQTRQTREADMKDDFDDRIGLPEDELGGSSDLSEMGGGAEEVEAIEVIEGEPAGRVSGGARARSSSGPRKRPMAARKSAPARAKGKTKKAPRKAAAKKRSAKRSAGASKKRAGRKGGGRKSARK